MNSLLQLTASLLNNTDYYNSVETILKHNDFPNIERIKFALHCAQNLDKYYDLNKYPNIKKTRDKCLELVADYILASSENKKEALCAAANAAYAAANAAYAAYAAANAAYAAANAASAAAYAAANAAYAAANAAAYAATAAAYVAANAAFDKTFISKEFEVRRQEVLKQLFLNLVEQVFNFSNIPITNKRLFNTLYASK